MDATGPRPAVQPQAALAWAAPGVQASSSPLQPRTPAVPRPYHLRMWGVRKRGARPRHRGPTRCTRRTDQLRGLNGSNAHRLSSYQRGCPGCPRTDTKKEVPLLSGALPRPAGEFSAWNSVQAECGRPRVQCASEQHPSGL